ncbi:hypothetical protein B0T19DRAFT_429356 [Cercophora scortea]|uniref:Snf7 n=1 Tax=Cercophora scortea TaxID=314031 RepID=A0AAE0IHC3_9PEZI|nr:hypothetical protein B0T19DRAFT_429356 [Cercophora scortea]
MSRLLDFLIENEPGFNRGRLPVLYSDFADQRALNPDGYKANIATWRRGLAAITRSGLAPARKATAPSTLILTCDEQLIRALESPKYGRPLGLATVVREALAERDLIPLADFLAASDSIYHRPSAWSAWNLAAWTIKKLGVADALQLRGSKLPSGQFVVLANVEEAGRQVGDKVVGVAAAAGSSRFERTFSRAHFYRTVNEGLAERLSDADVEVLLKFLSRDKGVIAYDGRTVRIKQPGAEQHEAAAITEEDASIAQLKELLGYLTHQTGLLSKRVDELGLAAKEAVGKKNRVAALAALKAKKLAETTLEKRFATVGQLEEVAARIEQAADNVQLVRVMEASAEALQGLNAQVGGAERVEAVVDRMREQMDAADEVNVILAESGEVVDEAEIDDELAAMELEEMRKVEEAERRAREAREAKEAEEMQKRLDAIGEVPVPVPVPVSSGSGQEETEVEQMAESMMSKLSLDEQPEPQQAA